MVIALSKTGKKEVPMFLREQEGYDLKAKTLQVFVATYMQNGFTIVCDGNKANEGLKKVAKDARVYDHTSGDLQLLRRATGLQTRKSQNIQEREQVPHRKIRDNYEEAVFVGESDCPETKDSIKIVKLTAFLLAEQLYKGELMWQI